MSQYLLSVPHDSDEEPTMETMDPAKLEAAMAATGAIEEERSEQLGQRDARGVVRRDVVT